jgi:hypothetical protein
MMYHGGYGYDPYAPYSPISTPVPAGVSRDGQLYSPQQFSFSAPYYQQPVQPGMPYLSSPTPISQGETMMPIDPTQGAFIAATLSPNSFLFGPRPGYYLFHAFFYIMLYVPCLSAIITLFLEMLFCRMV